MRAIHLLIGGVLICGVVVAEDTRVPPSVVQQLKRLEPLTSEKIQVFVDSGQLTPAQANLIRAHAPRGVLNLPAERVGVPVASPPAVQAPAVGRGGIPRLSGGEVDVLRILAEEDRTPIGDDFAADRRRVAENLRAYRHVGPADQEAIRRDIQRLGPAVNDLVGGAFNDPIDTDVKFEICTYSANAANPRAAGYIAGTHQALMHKASPIFIPYDKDAGGLIFRRQEGNEESMRRFYSSRELREYVLGFERLISHCAGPRAAIYLMSVYEARYGGEEAPMRDKDRDRERLVRACGASNKDMKEGDPKTWETTLAPLDRLLIAERLVPYLNHYEKDVREIARHGLLVVCGQSNKRLKDFFKDAPNNWGEVQRWWSQRRDEMLKDLK